jgi:hypothetical protein
MIGCSFVGTEPTRDESQDDWMIPIVTTGKEQGADYTARLSKVFLGGGDTESEEVRSWSRVAFGCGVGAIASPERNSQVRND